MIREWQGPRWALLPALGLAAGILVGGFQQAARGLVGVESWNWAEMALHERRLGTARRPQAESPAGGSARR